MDTDIGSEDARAEEASPVQAIALNGHFQAASLATEFKVFQGLRLLVTGTFPTLEDGSNSRLGPAKDLYMGEKLPQAPYHLSRRTLCRPGHQGEQACDHRGVTGQIKSQESLVTGNSSGNIWIDSGTAIGRDFSGRPSRTTNTSNCRILAEIWPSVDPPQTCGARLG